MSIIPDSLNNRPRFDEIARLHRDAFNWRPQGRIPLGIHVADPRHAVGMEYSEWLNPVPFFDYQANVLLDTLAVGSDLLPAVALNHFGEAVLTSMFGAEQLLPDAMGATLQDYGPTPLPVFESIGEVEPLEMPTLDAGIMPDVRRFARYYRERLPDWVHVVAPMPSGAFTLAQELRGFDMLTEMAECPDLCSKLINMVALLQVQVEKDIRSITGEPNDVHITSFSIMGAGLRVGEDTCVNLSPTMIRQLCLPAVRLTNEQLGGKGHVHFCSLPHSRFEHMYPVLAESADVAVVSTQFGFEYYESHLDELRGRLAVESFYGDAHSYVSEKYGSFRDWAMDFVPRYKNDSGLVLFCTVKSVEEGRDVWSAWEEAHGR